MQRIGDGRTGQVLSGRAIERSGVAVCDLHHARGDKERKFFGSASKPRSMVCEWFGFKTTRTVFAGLTSKSVVTVSSGLVSKPVATVSTGLASKPVAMVLSSLASKPVTTVFSNLASKLVVTVSPDLTSKPLGGFLVEP
jgi:hypothetical protein